MLSGMWLNLKFKRGHLELRSTRTCLRICDMAYALSLNLVTFRLLALFALHAEED